MKCITVFASLFLIFVIIEGNEVMIVKICKDETPVKSSCCDDDTYNQDSMGGDQPIPLTPIVEFGYLCRASFPPGFILGAGSSAFQIEGAMGEEYGRGKSMWDVFCEDKAKETEDDSWLGFQQGNQHYFKYQTDVNIMSSLSLDAYRFSISWPRIFPKGRPGRGNADVNAQGVNFYNNLINALIAKGIVPYVTLFHWEVPQVLEEEYGGFLSDKIRNDFKVFASFCFHEFGDRVKNWFTLNEPYHFSLTGYGIGSGAPGHGYFPPNLQEDGDVYPWTRFIPTSKPDLSPPLSSQQNTTDQSAKRKDMSAPGIEPYQVGRNLLLAHADVVHLYRSNFQRTQNGKIGITFNCNWFEPLNDTDDDRTATQRAFAFMLGWFMDPVITGQYPTLMTSTVPEERLKPFGANESEWIKNTYDFIGLNYYTAHRVKNAPQLIPLKPPHMLTDHGVLYHSLGDLNTSKWIYVYPKGIGGLLKYVAKTYGDIDLYITENGIDIQGDLPYVSQYDYLSDKFRAKFIHDHLYYLLDVVHRKGIKLKGYFVWSLLDSFEWSNGNSRFGINYVDYENNYNRLPKWSSFWYATLAQSPRLIHPPFWPPIKPADPNKAASPSPSPSP